MTTESFKKDYPEYSHLEGNDLLDAMTYTMLRHQQAEEIVKQIQPFWKRYRLRWLMYRKIPNWVLEHPKHSYKEVCKSCKTGSSSYMTWGGKAICMCGNERILVPNKSWQHKLWKIGNTISKCFWWLMDKLHIVRSDVSGRYDMFGDEACYVEGYRYTKNWEPAGRIMKKRKWYEYIFIRK